jgi:hypothetical protein
MNRIKYKASNQPDINTVNKGIDACPFNSITGVVIGTTHVPYSLSRKKKSCAVQVSYFGNWNYLISSTLPPTLEEKHPQESRKKKKKREGQVGKRPKW